MTDLEIKAYISDLIANARNKIEEGKREEDADKVIFLLGYKDACLEILRHIKFTMEKELTEMEKQENEK